MRTTDFVNVVQKNTGDIRRFIPRAADIPTKVVNHDPPELTSGLQLSIDTWPVGRFVGRSAGSSAGRPGRPVAQSVGRSVRRSARRSVSRWAAHERKI
jgi:hypothetical protein